jgi:hypothetical protein
MTRPAEASSPDDVARVHAATPDVDPHLDRNQLGTPPVDTPPVKAVPLPSVSDVSNEEIFNLRMSWQGKVYELVMGSNDA